MILWNSTLLELNVFVIILKTHKRCKLWNYSADLFLKYPAHFHDHQEVIQLLDGELVVEILNQNLKILDITVLKFPGQLMIIPRGQIHKTYTNKIMSRYMEYKQGPNTDKSTKLCEEIEREL